MNILRALVTDKIINILEFNKKKKILCNTLISNTVPQVINCLKLMFNKFCHYINIHYLLLTVICGRVCRQYIVINKKKLTY